METMLHVPSHDFRGASVAPPGPADIADLARKPYRLTGIALSERKGEVLVARLGRRLNARGISDWASYRALLAEDADEQTAFAEAMTTHTTSFFRERAQYDWLLNEGVVELYPHPWGLGRELVFWSAACSTGQEGYTALLVADQARERGLWEMKTRLVGTDLSRPVLKVAAQAIYPTSQIESIPAGLRPRVLLSSRNGDGRHRIVPELRRRAAWRQANLVTGIGLDGVAADVMSLRNVLIYFDAETRSKVLDNVFARLRVGGVLLVGHTEAAHARRDGLEIVRPSIYRKVHACWRPRNVFSSSTTAPSSGKPSPRSSRPTCSWRSWPPPTTRSRQPSACAARCPTSSCSTSRCRGWTASPSCAD